MDVTCVRLGRILSDYELSIYHLKEMKNLLWEREREKLPWIYKYLKKIVLPLARGTPSEERATSFASVIVLLLLFSIRGGSRSSSFASCQNEIPWMFRAGVLQKCHRALIGYIRRPEKCWYSHPVDRRLGIFVAFRNSLRSILRYVAQAQSIDSMNIYSRLHHRDRNILTRLYIISADIE